MEDVIRSAALRSTNFLFMHKIAKRLKMSTTRQKLQYVGPRRRVVALALLGGADRWRLLNHVQRMMMRHCRCWECFVVVVVVGRQRCVGPRRECHDFGPFVLLLAHPNDDINGFYKYHKTRNECQYHGRFQQLDGTVSPSRGPRYSIPSSIKIVTVQIFDEFRFAGQGTGAKSRLQQNEAQEQSHSHYHASVCVVLLASCEAIHTQKDGHGRNGNDERGAAGADQQVQRQAPIIVVVTLFNAVRSSVHFDNVGTADFQRNMEGRPAASEAVLE
mmetsp:Transcript_482/g.953  ORF Transcript_482/g.953 Transcript_482/m.953 type:complete len:273 (-) Transcript_482:134-952(-)